MAIRKGVHAGVLFPAPLGRFLAAGAEAAAFWHLVQGGNGSVNGVKTFIFSLVDARDGAQQAVGVGVERVVKNLLQCAVLHVLAGVHDHDMVRHLRHNAHIVGNQDDRSVEIVGQLAHQAQDLRHRYVVTLEDNTKMEQTAEQLKNLPGVAKVSAAYELAQGFTTLQNVLHIVSVAVIAVLLVVSLLIISNTVKLAMYDRRDEIAIMKMVGATNGFIRLPFVVEGFSLGMIGAILAFGLEWLGYDAMIAKIGSVDALQLFNFVPFQELLLPMVATFAAAGMFVGIVGSWTSIRKFMDV